MNSNNKRLTLISFLFIVPIIGCSSQQKADRKFDVSVASPAFTTNYPRVLFDEVHNNMHTARGTYLPFVELIKNDGCVVEVNTNPFSTQSLNSFDILVILGEAAMVTAQVYKGERFGMNVPGNDNKQFALNIIKWLGKAL